METNNKYKSFVNYFIMVQIVKMMDDEDGVINRKKRKAGGGKRKGQELRPLLSEPGGGGGLAGQEMDEDANYLTVTSVELKNWFRGITGGHRNAAPPPPPTNT